MTDLIRRVELAARRHGARRVTLVRLRLGALVQVSPDHLREHFAEAARGTLAEGCGVEIEVLDDVGGQYAQDVVLDSIEIEDDGVEGATR
ncbi:MAG: hydrogenase maturation nickel metallochaperone HypA [Armatimonadota bacterium]|nr:hydrogenase maturation nickel metallochaperone HypA [Armatimonadota bacterium]